ncbi:MAG TPA: LysE family translocator [Candidatus Limnocylindrales bacterium]|jgi:threonine/homoserine/homoserine lactone efflux protein|nr:LysE family translocator [Candidatus Limnocylindrales bacterium]
MPVPLERLLPFLLGSILITMVPGPDMALVMRQVFIGGTALAQRTVYGNLTGLVVHTAALAAGLSALLAASAEAYSVVKLAGAAYLVYLGVQTLRSARRAQWDDETDVASRSVPSMRMGYAQGLVSTVLNPKTALLFYTYLPQFVDSTRPVLPQIAFLGAVHILVGLVWMSAYVLLVARAHRTLTRPSVRRRIEAITGAVIILLGLRVALDQR